LNLLIPPFPFFGGGNEQNEQIDTSIGFLDVRFTEVPGIRHRGANRPIHLDGAQVRFRHLKHGMKLPNVRSSVATSWALYPWIQPHRVFMIRLSGSVRLAFASGLTVGAWLPLPSALLPP
jgi:hypothetical protein